MFRYSLFAISAIIICTVATTINQAVCTDLLIPIEITATTFVPNFAPFNGSTEATNFMLQLLNGYTTAPFKGTQNNTSSFIISAQYCTPFKPSARSTTLHLMTSGIGLDKTYGSELTHGLAATAPHLSDGIVLTGFTYNKTKDYPVVLGGHSINANQPERFAHLGNGYLTWPDQYALQYVYFSWPDFDPGVVAAFEENKWPLSTGQLLTHPAYVLPAPAFTGPVMYINGNNDLCYCFSNCTGLLTPALTELYFPNASVVEVLGEECLIEK
ncbi:hypothetical protein L207DRAFT_529410 [Hyaloscypha variabilis F]|uniref:Uncharacterized protein n=1 Tax=Hyaloscypha variabilis (strain UAMH 11265 / GT02V1 / F) TaxID=1149755 RepID=A0A2J6RLS4_HYAVF|nr:hypothetical protein L207DRAFT_529410 [Hyaloscypha variabilis F]